MKYFITTFGLALLLVTPCFAREELMLARITGYWRGEGSGERAAWSGARLHTGHCAVDPKRIPYGSKVVFPDVECVAVDTGPAVVSRKSARYCGRNTTERNAIVVDRFFETRADAVSWTNAHPQFMTLRVVTPDHNSKRASSVSSKGLHRPPTVASRGALTLQPSDPFRRPATLE